jgi:decaprenylphospho-beta-D-ribofuranose 2-oxidase
MTLSWPDGASADKSLVSFDGGSRAEASVQQPDRYRFFHAAHHPACSIARGAGLSLSAASFGAGAITVDLRAFDRILDFDSSAGVVEVEAGLTLGVLFHFLEKRGFYLPVQPGYPAISVGGCIATDVHGKNAARDGTFIKQVQSVRLFHPSHGLVEVSPETGNDLFRATCGGFGLTGIILTAQLKAARLPARAVQATLHFVSNLPEAVDKLTLLSPENDFAFGWHDLNFSDARFGRGYITASRFVDAPVQQSDSFIDRDMTSERRQIVPFPLLNRFTSRAMNIGYRLSLAFGILKPANVFRATFPFYGKELYFTLFGRGGFHETQVIVARDRFTEYVEALREAVTHTGAVICFAALKLFAGTNDLVRFDGNGLSLALHLPRSGPSARFLDIVDRMTIEMGGRPSAIKDSRLPGAVFEATYPDCDRFKAIIDDWDPKRAFRSALTTRLGL